MIETIDLHKSHGSLQVLRGISLTVAEGEVAAIIGPSGGGKSTFLRCLNGLESFQAGEVRIGQQRLAAGNHDRNSQDALRRVRLQLGMVFQQFNLFPHLTVLGNVIEAPIRVLKLSREEAVSRAKNCSTASDWLKKSTCGPTSFPAASNSAWPSRGRWRCSPRRCCSTSRPAPWIRA